MILNILDRLKVSFQKETKMPINQVSTFAWFGYLQEWAYSIKLDFIELKKSCKLQDKKPKNTYFRHDLLKDFDNNIWSIDGDYVMHYERVDTREFSPYNSEIHARIINYSTDQYGIRRISLDGAETITIMLESLYYPNQNFGWQYYQNNQKHQPRIPKEFEIYLKHRLETNIHGELIANRLLSLEPEITIWLIERANSQGENRINNPNLAKEDLKMMIQNFIPTAKNTVLPECSLLKHHLKSTIDFLAIDEKIYRPRISGFTKTESLR